MTTVKDFDAADGPLAREPKGGAHLPTGCVKALARWPGIALHAFPSLRIKFASVTPMTV